MRSLLCKTPTQAHPKKLGRVDMLSLSSPRDCVGDLRWAKDCPEVVRPPPLGQDFHSPIPFSSEPRRFEVLIKNGSGRLSPKNLVKNHTLPGVVLGHAHGLAGQAARRRAAFAAAGTAALARGAHRDGALALLADHGDPAHDAVRGGDEIPIDLVEHAGRAGGRREQALGGRVDRGHDTSINM